MRGEAIPGGVYCDKFGNLYVCLYTWVFGSVWECENKPKEVSELTYLGLFE